MTNFWRDILEALTLLGGLIAMFVEQRRIRADSMRRAERDWRRGRP
jgi:hypothetical protein